MLNNSKIYHWDQLSTTDFAKLDLAKVIAVLPVGATEQHGPHLPLCVDSALVDGVIQHCLPYLNELAAFSDLPVLFLPTQKIGFSPEHQNFAGTLSLKASTLLALWTDILDSVANSGIQKILILNAHGGQSGLLDVVGRDIRQRHKILVYSANFYDLPANSSTQNLFTEHEKRFGIHAGDLETSMMMALHANLIRHDELQNFESYSEQRALNFAILGNGKSAKMSWAMQDYNPLGATGNASNASAEKGQLLVQNYGFQFFQLLQELHRVNIDF